MKPSNDPEGVTVVTGEHLLPFLLDRCAMQEFQIRTEQWPMERESVQRAVSWLDALMRMWGFPCNDVEGFCIAASEIFDNAIVHAVGDTSPPANMLGVTATSWVRNDQRIIVLFVTGNGTPINLSKAHATIDAPTLKECGRGFAITAALADVFLVFNGTDGVILSKLCPVVPVNSQPPA